LRYPETRYLIGRARLSSLKQSTLLTLLEVLKDWGLKPDKHYRYNSQQNFIKFHNGSEIWLKDLFLYPTDPEFDSLGSTEYTGALIDECSQISEKAYRIVTSRLRYKLDKYGLVPKIMLGTNPAKNFAYYLFYQPSIQNKLPPYRVFIPAFVTDNQYISQHYVDNLNKLDEKSKQRLLHGNWEYDDDPSVMIDYDKIIDMFLLTGEFGNKYLSVDVARFGSDRTVYIVWDGLHIKQILTDGHTSTKDVRKAIEHLCKKHKIPRSNVVIDSDGVGGGVCDELEGVRNFVNNSSAIDNEEKRDKKDMKVNYRNLKSQCYDKLADYINKGLIGVYPEIDIKVKEDLIKELEQVKRKNWDKDTKFEIIPKDEVKELIGRSPDISDAVMQRMWFELPRKQYGFFMG